MVNLKTVEELSNAFGPSGFEEEVIQTVQRHMDGFELKNDAMNNLYATMPGNKGERPVIMLDAHTDECGLIVQHIDSNGLMGINMLGGFHITSLPGHSVVIRNQKGEKIHGVITSKAMHFMSPEEKGSNAMTIKDLKVDVGASSREEAMEEYGIRPGDPIAPEIQFRFDEKHGICSGKAFDNRMGCVCIIETMKALKDEAAKLGVDVVGGFAAQEEVGTRGAAVTAQVVKPDFAIVFEGSPADDPYIRIDIAQGKLKGGTQIRRMDTSYITNPAFMEVAEKIANKCGIKYQNAVRYYGGTNAGKISLANHATPVLVLGVPSRYVHAHRNFCALEDIQASVDLAANVIRHMDAETMKHILRQDILV